MNIRDEAVLRELNLYPLWVLRKGNSEAVGHPAASPCVNSVQPLAGNGLPDVVMRGLRGASAAADSAPVSSVPAEETQPVMAASREPVPRQSETSATALLNWPELKQKVHDCTACKLRAGCTQTVFGVGDEKAEWLFVGEGPGAEEDAQGEPFVGQAGKLLDNMLAAIKLKRGSNVYIANIVKCRPPENRIPEPDEIATCLPYLQQQIALIKPKLIVALGNVAATSLLMEPLAVRPGESAALAKSPVMGREATLGSLRGTIHDYQGIPLIVTYHPAYLLRSPAEKAKAWQDLRQAVQVMSQQV